MVERRLREVLYAPHTKFYFLFFTAILGFTLSLLFLGVVGAAFKTLFPTLPPLVTLVLLSGCLMGSYINVPITRIRSERPVIRVGRVKAFGVTYYVPMLATKVNETLLAINVGGAIIPLAMSVYLIIKAPEALVSTAFAVIFVTVIVKSFSRPIVGVGIVSPTFIPPLSAALAAILLDGTYTHLRIVIAYVSGTLGTLLGADLLNFKAFPKLGSPLISIGGAGTFDGIFLSGIVAVLIAFEL